MVKKGTYTSQAIDGSRVQEPQEQLVSHQNCAEQVAKHQSTEVVLGIREPTECGHDHSGQVEQGDKGEELSVGIEPNLKEDPSANLSFWSRCFLSC